MMELLREILYSHEYLYFFQLLPTIIDFACLKKIPSLHGLTWKHFRSNLQSDMNIFPFTYFLTEINFHLPLRLPPNFSTRFSYLNSIAPPLKRRYINFFFCVHYRKRLKRTRGA